MDKGQCSAVFIDDRVKQERWLCNEENDGSSAGVSSILSEEGSEFARDVELLLNEFKQVYLCNSGKTFASKLAELNEACQSECVPIFAIIDITLKGDSESIRRRSIVPAPGSLAIPPSSTSAPRRSLTFSSESEGLHGFHLLSRFSTDIQTQEPNLIVPVAIIRADSQGSTEDLTSSNNKEISTQRIDPELENKQIRRCLDAGAADVLSSPLDPSRVKGLAVHGYHVQRNCQKQRAGFLANRKLRQLSWVGTDDEQPYSYLREAMVSKLMKRICNPEEVLEDFQASIVPVLQDRVEMVRAAVSEWKFSAHDFTDDELIYAATVMLEHALQMPELEHWRISTNDIRSFLFSVRSAYNAFVFYHNFRHAVDVLQCVFHSLVKLGALPPFPSDGGETSTKSGLASILTPFDALTLLITAIGHDVGHPGVNNVFLVKLDAPLAQLYNDRSVLEAFHCAAYSQILRRHWPTVCKDKTLRKLMIDSILSTDMGVHATFMENLGKLQVKYRTNNRTLDGWESKDIDAYRNLICSLLIKCADISNVARPFSVAEKWTDILQQEFANQGVMEENIGMETALFGGPPEIGNFGRKAKGQIGFMNFFALPLFDGVADILPDMAFAANEIRRNKIIWQKLIDQDSNGNLSEKSKLEATTSTPENPTQQESQNPSSVYYTIPAEGSPKDPKPDLLQVDGGSDDEADNGTVTNVTSDKKETLPIRDRSATLPSDEFSNGVRSSESNESRRPTTGGSGSHWAGRACDFRLAQGPRASERRGPTITPLHHQGDSTGGGRNQSTSTYTNHTIMTPVSCTTQASSFITADSNYDEKDFANRAHGQVAGSTVPSSYGSSVGDGPCDEGTSDRSTPVGPVGDSNHHSNNQQSVKRKPSFMSSLFDKSFGSNHHHHHHHNGGPPPKSLPSSSTSVGNYPVRNQQRTPELDIVSSNGSSLSNGRPLNRRRSRLRLAFWRRNKQTQSPPNYQHFERTLTP